MENIIHSIYCILSVKSKLFHLLFQCPKTGLFGNIVLWNWFQTKLNLNIIRVCLFISLDLTSHIAMVPACSSVTLTIVLPHRNAMLQTQDMTPHLSQYQTHGRYIDVELTQEAITTHFNFFGLTRPKNALLSSHT